jgi:hypothetical protein
VGAAGNSTYPINYKKKKSIEEPLRVDSFFVSHRQGSRKRKSRASHFHLTFSEAEPVGGESVIFRFPSPGTIPIPSGECVKVGVAAVAIGAVVKAIMHLGRFFQTAVYVEMNTPEVSPEIFRPPRLRGFDPLVDKIQKGVVFFPDHLVLPVPVGFCAFRITSAFPGGIIREVSRDDPQDDDADQDGRSLPRRAPPPAGIPRT